MQQQGVGGEGQFIIVEGGWGEGEEVSRSATLPRVIEAAVGGTGVATAEEGGLCTSLPSSKTRGLLSRPRADRCVPRACQGKLAQGLAIGGSPPTALYSRDRIVEEWAALNGREATQTEEVNPK